MAHENEKSISRTIGDLTHGIKRLGILYFEKARLKTTEKITILLATIAFSAVMMALGIVFFIFVSIGIGHYLATTMAPHMAYLIVAAFYLIILLVTMSLRRRLFVDPIARFMSRLLVEEPEEIRAERTLNTHHKKEEVEHETPAAEESETDPEPEEKGDDQ